jgi:probable phosphoglycerate mutase
MGMPDWESDPHAVTFPGGETLAEMHHRVGRTLQTVMARHAGGTVVVCCHGGVVNVVLRLALRTPITGGFELFTANASMTELLLVRPGRWRLLRYNDTAHLAGLPAESPRP